MRHVYNKYWLLLLSAIAINGCYTLFRHPDVEVTYNDDQTFTEKYEVLVDEDCQSCHNNIKINEHFNPETYTVENDWNATPWWRDANYKVIFGDGIVETQQVDQSAQPAANTINLPLLPNANANQYITAPSTGDTSSNNSQLNKSTAIDSSQADNDKNASQKKSSSNKQNKKVKRKFKKRI